MQQVPTLLDAPPELTLWNRMYDGQQFFLKFRDTLETTLTLTTNYTRPNRMSKQGGRPQQCSYRPELPLFLQMYGQPSEELGGPPRVASHPLELADTIRTRELTCERYPKWSSLNFFMNTLHIVDCATCGETIRTLTIFGEFTHVWNGKSTHKGVFSA